MKRFALLAASSLAGFGIAVACGDPYDGDIPTPAPDRDAAIAVDSAPEASPVEDASSDVTDAAADVDPCSDRDKDGVIARECDGGLDCDDEDDRAQPDSGFRTDLPTTATTGDWNCDGKINVAYPMNLKCSDYTSDTFGNGCAYEGFLAAVGCGESGDFVKCKGVTLGGPCQVGAPEKRKQGCK